MVRVEPRHILEDLRPIFQNQNLAIDAMFAKRLSNQVNIGGIVFGDQDMTLLWHFMFSSNGYLPMVLFAGTFPLLLEM